MNTHLLAKDAVDLARFPHPVYISTVLGPLFDEAKHHHVGDLDRVNRAHLVMLAETGIVSREAARDLARALAAMTREVDYAALRYDGTVEEPDRTGIGATSHRPRRRP